MESNIPQEIKDKIAEKVEEFAPLSEIIEAQGSPDYDERFTLISNQRMSYRIGLESGYQLGRESSLPEISALKAEVERLKDEVEELESTIKSYGW